ncbi:MAG: hypothetical protein LBS34_02940 [Rickettsiales bacterium]|jgi:F-type H+-transporting ATPase subunit c|nr:hypothetical protein [Rickettsiales bacterium]
MDNLIIVACVSMVSAAGAVALGSSITASAEGGVAKQALQSMAQQPDEGAEISKTLFVSLSLIESSAIYCLLVAMILLFSNPFWNFLATKLG